METYKTFKPTNEENKVEKYVNQFGNVQAIVIVNSKEYSLELLEEDTLQDQRSEFFCDYGKNTNSEKAFNLIQENI